MPAAGVSRCPAPPEAGPPAETAISSKVRFLGRPDSYPERPSRVDIIETHYSWIFLTDTHAYKLKKPVRGVGFDFRSVAARRRNAALELRLNRRLAPEIYLGIVPLSLGADGKLALGGPGEPVDWLVKMVRLGADRVLDRRLAQGNWHYADLEALANRLARFFAGAARVRLSLPRLNARMDAELRATVNALQAAGPPRLLAALKPVVRRLECFRRRHAALLRRRIAEHRIVEGHGDLRPEHVYLNGIPRIIDCLEFRADLRRLDPVSELAYLALECRRLGVPGVERRLIRRYCERSGDAPSRLLVHFYTALNAVIRVRIAIEHLADPGARGAEEYVNRAAAYLAIAARESLFLSR